MSDYRRLLAERQQENGAGDGSEPVGEYRRLLAERQNVENSPPEKPDRRRQGSRRNGAGKEDGE